MRRFALFLACLLTAASFAAAQSNARVGLVTRAFEPKASRNWRGQPDQALHTLIWYPAMDTVTEVKQYLGPLDAPLFEAGSASPNAEWAPSLEKLPLIVISHGSGGSAKQIAWLGTALARLGYVAVAVDHPGNSGGSGQTFTAEGFVLWWERATDLSEVIDGILADPELGPHIDSSRIGAAGFSLGGYTVLELAGARTDISVYYDDCRTKPDQTKCHTPEMRGLGTPEDMLAKVRKSSGESLARSGDTFADPRIRAVFAIAPGLSEALTQESLREIRVPVEVVVGNADSIATLGGDAAYVRSNIRGARETILPGGVSHYTFLDSCAPAGAAKYPAYCTEAPGISREAVHALTAQMAAEFFGHWMPSEKKRAPKLKKGKDK